MKSILNKAKILEKKHDWFNAADSYDKALNLAGSDDSKRMPEICVQKAFCLLKAAFQSETHQDFLVRIKQAMETYQAAAELFERVQKGYKIAQKNHSKAMASYASSWIAEDSSKRRESLGEYWRLEKEVLKSYEETQNSLGFGKICNELLEVFSIYRFWFVSSWSELERNMEEVLGFGEKTIAIMSDVGDEYGLARAYCWTSFCYGWAVWLRALKQKMRDFTEKCLNYSMKALKLAERIGDPYLISISNLSAGTARGFIAGDLHFARRCYKDQQKQGDIIKDNYHTGTAAMWLALSTWLSMITLEEDLDRQRIGLKEATQHAEDALHHLSIINHHPFIVFTYYPYTESFTRMAYIENDAKAKCTLLEKAVEVGREGLRQAQVADCTFFTRYVLSALSIALYWLSNITLKVAEKRILLEEALKHRKEAIHIEQQVSPFDYWIRGDSQNYRALIEAELGEIELKKDKKIKLLEKAVSSMDNCLKYCVKDVRERPQVWKYGSLGRFHYWFGRILNQLYLLKEDKRLLERAIVVHNGAVKAYGKIEQPSRMAESHWQIGKLYDHIGDYSGAAHSYEVAAEEFKSAAEKVPQLTEFYEGHSLYMRAWSQIEKARHSHAREQYYHAMEHYDKATNLHESSRLWSYLAPNYLAWAQLEKAEDLSRREKSEEAIHTFREALDLFIRAGGFLEAEIAEIQTTDEKEMVIELIKASEIRRRYCECRVNLEEAKILDRKGKYALSSVRYGSASETLRSIIEAEHGIARREFRPIMYLCNAWQKMTLAKAKTSRKLYLEASKLFEKANENSFSKTTSLLAMANSSVCKALAAGAEFEKTLDMAAYSMAKQHTERAATCYLRAGFKTASEYVRATQRFFDAYVYMNNAETETDPEKKTKYYYMAEKVLQVSADLYVKAKYIKKGEEIHRILDKVREERELAASLSEVLHAPPIASTTISFATPTPTHEKSVGLERFEHANIQAHLTAQQEVTTEEDLEIQLDLVNVAKNFGLLIRVDDIIPQGFRVSALPPQCSIMNNSIDLRGKRLGPLKVESIKIFLQAIKAGVINLSPRVVYVDELGKFRTCRPEPINVTVHPQLAFEFKTTSAQKVFGFLVNSFVDDYMRRRTSLEKSGWRTLMEIVKHGKVSKFSVYGDKAYRGRAVSELERRGLVEMRVFPGERGRGGKIQKLRISYEKETIRRYVDKYVMKRKNK